MELTLRQLRQISGVTQAEMAKQMGVNQAIYSAWEQLDDDKIAKIASTLNAKPSNKLRFVIGG